MSAPLLEMEGIEKSLPGVRAIRQGRFELRAGEIHALMGENGAGKSTLIKVLGGAHQPEAGSIRIDGVTVRIPSPHETRRLGVAVIYQEFNLVPALTVRENLFLGRERARGGFIAAGEERKLARGLFERLGFPLDLDALCRDLPIAQQQAVEIAKALLEKARILVMDEPTAALSSHEVEKLFQVVRDLRTQGIGIIYVSHRLDEIFALCDRVTVMRDGGHIATAPVSELSRQRLIELMVGRKLEAEFPKRVAKIGPPSLEARGLCRGRAVRDVSLSIRSGEVIGLTGLVGAGRTELARLLFGADRAEAGTIFLRGQQPWPQWRERTGLRNLFTVAQTFLSAVTQAFQPADRPDSPRKIAQSPRTADKNVGDTADSKVCDTGRSAEFIPLLPRALRSPRDAIRSGICLLTEDRKQQGLVLGLPVRENFALPNLPFFSRLGFMRRRSEREACRGFIQRLRIKVSHPEQLARNLSGGNQQKVVLAKWLQANSEVVIFDEPTRGIDVGAKFEIYQLINDLAAAGKAILMISSELPEILGMSDRILVMRAGSISGEINDVLTATQEQIMDLAAL